MFKLGVDLGSSTAKVVLLTKSNEVIYKKYMRHNGKVKEVLLEILKYLSRQYNKETIRSLEPLFTNETEYKEFKKRHKKLTIFHLDESKFSDVKKMAICGKSA